MELHLAYSKCSIKANYLVIHYCLLILIWQIWAPLCSASPSISWTSFSTSLPHTPSHTGYLAISQRYQAPFYLRAFACSVPSTWNHLAPNIHMIPSSFSLCSGVDFLGRMSITTCNLLIITITLYSLSCFQFSLEHLASPNRV